MKQVFHREPNSFKRRFKKWADRQFIYDSFPDGTEIRELKGRWVLLGFIGFIVIAYGFTLVAESIGRGTPV